MSEKINNPNRPDVIREFSENLNSIEKAIKILRSNYEKNRRKTIRIINNAGFTVENIISIQEKCNMYRTGKVRISVKDVEESQQILEHLKNLCQIVTYGTIENESAYENSNDRQTDRETSDIEHIEAEIVTAEEFGEIRKREEERKYDIQTEEMFRMVNQHSDKARDRKENINSNMESKKAVGEVSGIKGGATSRGKFNFSITQRGGAKKESIQPNIDKVTETSGIEIKETSTGHKSSSEENLTKAEGFRRLLANMAKGEEFKTTPPKKEKNDSEQNMNKGQKDEYDNQTKEMIRIVNQHSDKAKISRDEKAEEKNSAERGNEKNSTGRANEKNSAGRANEKNSAGRAKNKSRKIRSFIKNIRNKAKTLDTKGLVRNLAAGALAASFLIGVANYIHETNEYEEDVQSRIEYIDDIIDRNGTALEYSEYLSLDCTEEEINEFLEVDREIDSYQGKKQTDLKVSNILSTADKLSSVYKSIIKKQLEKVFGYEINDYDIEVLRERENIDGRAGDFNENGRVRRIASMDNIVKGKLPKELTNAIIVAYGEEGIEKPAMTIEQLKYKLDNQEMNKTEASEYLGYMLKDLKEFMTRQYKRGENGKVCEISSEYNTKRDKEGQIKIQNVMHKERDDEMDR